VTTKAENLFGITGDWIKHCPISNSTLLVIVSGCTIHLHYMVWLQYPCNTTSWPLQCSVPNLWPAPARFAFAVNSTFNWHLSNQTQKWANIPPLLLHTESLPYLTPFPSTPNLSLSQVESLEKGLLLLWLLCCIWLAFSFHL
jgi:hypothetical protein